MLRFLAKLALVGLLSFPVVAEDTIVVGAFTVPIFLNEQGQGAFGDLFRLIIKEEKLNAELNLMPSVRARVDFDQQKTDVLVPGVASAIMIPHLASLPFFDKKVIAFSNQQTAITTAKHLQGHRVGYVRGFSYQPDLLQQTGTEYLDIGSDRQGMQMLLAGRIDVLLCEEYGGISLLNQLRNSDDITHIYYDIHTPLSIDPVYFAFQNNEKGARLKSIFDQAITKIRAEERMPEHLY